MRCELRVASYENHMRTNNIKFFSYFIVTIILTLGLSISLQSLLAAWTAPAAPPPTCATGDPGCDEPLNVSDTNQQKIGTLTLNTGGNANGLIVDQGNVGIGTVIPGAKLEVNGKIIADTPLDSDPDNIVATKGYVDAAAGGGWAGYTGAFTGNLGYVKGGSAKCDASYSGSHWCNLEEIIRLGTEYPHTYDVWINAENVTIGYNDAARCMVLFTALGGAIVDFAANSYYNCLEIAYYRLFCYNWNSAGATYNGLVYNTSGLTELRTCNTTNRLGCCY